MNIWKWVHDAKEELREAGHDRLADLIDDIPEHVSEGRQQLAEAALPEALASVRALRHPWLEVFLRHWVMNGRICGNKEGEAALKDAVELFEFAHRDNTMQCPQSICTTQDVAICYGNVDGPGWAAERMAVCEETLARIDPNWACFSCISCELLDALVDAGRAQEACELAERQQNKLLDQGQELSLQFHLTRARTLFSAGDSKAALALLAFIEESDFDDDIAETRYDRAALHAHILAKTGRVAEAWHRLPDEKDGAQYGENINTVSAIALIADQLPEHNTYLAGRRMDAGLRRYSRSGAHRLTLNVAQHLVRLAVARGARWSAQRALALARPHLAKLRAPLGAPELLAGLDAMVTAMPQAAGLPVPAEQLAAYLAAAEERNPERDVEWLLAAAAQRPDDATLTGAAAEAMQACGAAREAADFLWQFVRQYPAVHAPGSQLLGCLLTLRDHAGIEQLHALVDAANPALAHWCRARLAYALEAWSEAGEHVRRLLEIDPDASGPKYLWADAAMAAKDFDTALRLRQSLAAQETEIGSIHWDVMVAASAAQRWEVVRAIAAQLEFTLSTDEGVIEERWGSIRVRFFEKNAWVERYCRRTGPATARIRSLSPRRQPQHMGDWVVYDPVPLEALPDNEEERADFVQLYQMVHVLQASHFGPSFLVDGADPGEATFRQMADALDALGWEWSVRSEDAYTVSDPDGGDALPGLFFLVAAPAAVTPAGIDSKLKELTAGFLHPMCWPELAKEAGSDEDYHLGIVERYGL